MIVEIAIPVLVIALLVLAVKLSRQRRAQQQTAAELTRLEEDVKRLSADLAGLCKSSVGAGDHVVRLEQQVNRLIQRQNQTEMQTSTNRPYTEAIQLVQQGATAEDLIEKCGLTRGEADLIAMLHGIDKAS